MSWSKWIIVAFILFAGFIGTLVAVCMRAEVSLVSKDYYKEELEFQQQIVRIENTSALKNKPVIKLNNGVIQIAFDHFEKLEKGSLVLFRPSDAALDKTFALTPSAGSIREFSTESLDHGMYRARMQWTMEGKEFFHEEVIFL